jgi:hypothetical protein
VGLTYLVGARLLGPAAGVAAGLILAVSLQHVVDSHFATTDVPVTCLVVAALLPTLAYARAGRRRDALLAGLLGGVAASAKYNGALVGAPFLVAHVLRGRAAGSPWRVVLGDRAIPLWACGALFGFLVGTPFAALAPREFVRGLTGELGAIGTVQFGNDGDPGGLWFHLGHSLPQALGVPVLLAALVGLVVFLREGRLSRRAVLAFPLPYLAIIATWESRFERYAVPLLPFAAILAAAGMAALAARLPDAVRRREVAFVVLVTLVVLPPVSRLVYYAVLLSRPDSRELAGAWIDQAIPPGSRVAMERYSPPVRWASDGQGALAMLSPPPGIAERLPRQHRASPAVSRLRVSALDHYELGALARSGVDYVVLSSFVYKRHQAACSRFPGPCRFYRELEAAATLVFAVHPVPETQRLWVGDVYAPVSAVFARERPGPIIKIYRLSHD